MQLGAILLTLLVGASAPAPPVEPGQCGYDRWPVKILADSDRLKVDFRPVTATVTELANLPIPELAFPPDHRIAPAELKVFHVRALLIRLRTDQDRDFHLLIADPSDERETMTAEIPAPECTPGSTHVSDYRLARETVSHTALRSILIIEGVGFWDFTHPGRGRSNGFELHPVLRVWRE